MKTLLKSALIISAITAGVASTTAQADHGLCSKQISKCAAKQAVRKAKCDVKKAKCALKKAKCIAKHAAKHAKCAAKKAKCCKHRDYKRKTDTSVKPA